MDWIFNGLITWINSLVGKVFDSLSDMFSSAVGCSMDQFNDVFPFAATAENIILGVGLSLLFLIFLFQLFRTIWGPLADDTVEHPIVLLSRTIVFFPLVYFGKSIVQYVIYFASVPYTMLQNLDSGTKTTVYETMQSELSTSLGTKIGDATVTAFISLIFLVLIGWNYIKMLIEIAERYVVLGLIAYTAPVAIATGCSKTTNNIFKGWCRLVGSQAFLMIMNIWFLKMISSGFYNLSTYISTDNGTFVVWALLMIAMEKAAQAMDSYVKAIVGNVAITGNEILSDMAAVGASISTIASKFGGGHSSAGGGSGGGSGGSSPLSSLGKTFSASSFAADGVASGGQRQSFSGLFKNPAFALANAVPAAGAAAVRAGFSYAAKVGLDKESGKMSNLATNMVSRVAHGNGNKDYGYIKDTADKSLASKSVAHYFGKEGYSASNLKDSAIGNGEITTVANGQTVRYFDTNAYRAPTEGTYSTVKAEDGSNWYKQASGSDNEEFKKPERL